MQKKHFFRVLQSGESKKNSREQNRYQTQHLTMMITILSVTMLLFAACGGDSGTPVATSPTATTDTSATTDSGATPTVVSMPTLASTASSTPPVQPTAPLVVQPRLIRPTATPVPAHPSGNTVQVWIQVTDSCQQALSGGTFSISGPGINTTTSPTNGGGPTNVGTGGGCPIPHGNCGINAGCTTATLNIPPSGTTYTITIARTAPGQGTNLSYAVCEGGSACPHGPEVATVNVSSSGSVSATTLNIYPDGVPITYGPFNTSQSDPILFHEFGIGNGSISCDRDHDADDFLTGTPGGHCDSDGSGGHRA